MLSSFMHGKKNIEFLYTVKAKCMDTRETQSTRNAKSQFCIWTCFSGFGGQICYLLLPESGHTYLIQKFKMSYVSSVLLCMWKA